jgi:hypothetical protein
VEDAPVFYQPPKKKKKPQHRPQKIYQETYVNSTLLQSSFTQSEEEIKAKKDLPLHPSLHPDHIIFHEWFCFRIFEDID